MPFSLHWYIVCSRKFTVRLFISLPKQIGQFFSVQQMILMTISRWQHLTASYQSLHSSLTRAQVTIWFGIYLPEMRCSHFSRQWCSVYRERTVTVSATPKFQLTKEKIFQFCSLTGLTVSILKLLSSLLTSSGKSETDHFANLFDEMEAKTNQPKHTIVSGDGVIGYQKLVGKRKTEITHASELIFSFLVDLFHNSKSKLILHSTLKWWQTIYLCSLTDSTKIRSNLCKTIGLLLFGSVEVRKMALDIDFVNVVLDEIESILSKIGVYGDFVRKYGEQKKEPIIAQLKWLYNILMHWFSKDCLIDEVVIGRLCQIIIQTWPWSGANSAFQLLVIKTLAFISEDSVPGEFNISTVIMKFGAATILLFSVCKAMATCNVRNSQTVLQVVTEHVVSETSKPKQPNSNLESLELTLRTISNCCSCVEGRIQLTKVMRTRFSFYERKISPTNEFSSTPWIHWIGYIPLSPNNTSRGMLCSWCGSSSMKFTHDILTSAQRSICKCSAIWLWKLRRNWKWFRWR